MLRTLCLASVLFLGPTLLSAQNYCVIESLHAGPDNCEEVRPCGRVPCGFCSAHCHRYWCPCCGYCPLYDDTDIIDVTDRPTTWPGKHETSWMRELDR